MTKWWTVLITIALFAGLKVWNPDPVKSLRFIVIFQPNISK